MTAPATFGSCYRGVIPAKRFSFCAIWEPVFGAYSSVTNYKGHSPHERQRIRARGRGYYYSIRDDSVFGYSRCIHYIKVN